MELLINDFPELRDAKFAARAIEAAHAYSPYRDWIDWRSLSPAERLRMVELLRCIRYGDDYDNADLDKSVRFVDISEH